MSRLTTIAFVLVLAAPLGADTLFLRNGGQIQGKLVSASAGRLRFIEAGQRMARTYPVTSVNRVGFGDNNAPGTGERGRSATPTLPAGSVIRVRLLDSIDSNEKNTGNSYKAVVDEPVIVDGKTVIPQGAETTARVERIDPSGTSHEIGLTLTGMIVNGRNYAPLTENAVVSSKSHALVGAVTGTIAQEGGVPAQAIRGLKMQIPAETKLDFRLAQSLNIQ